MILDGFEVVAVDPVDSGLAVKVFLKSSGVKWEEAPGLWIKNKSGYLKIDFSKEIPLWLQEWVSINRDILAKHWKGDLSDRETLISLRRILPNKLDSEFLSSAFLRGMVFGKGVSEFEGDTAIMSIKKKKDIFLAVKKAYTDMSPRTFAKDHDWWECTDNVKADKKERKKEIEKAWKEEKSGIFEWLADEFYTYFQNDYTDFNNWHKTVCSNFLNKFKPILSEYGYDAEKSLKYGKAQKIVNMTFKYLLCFDDANNYSSKFNECHMPIDSYILKWYNDIGDNKCTTVWSDLEEKEYYELQENIKSILDKKNPFLAEFYIWAEYNR